MTTLTKKLLFKMKKVEIDGDTADRIVVCSLEDTIHSLKDSIKAYKKDLRKDGKDNHAKLEIGECTRFLAALEITYEYYGGNLK